MGQETQYVYFNFTKLIYRVNVISIKIPTGYFVEFNELKLILKYKGPTRAGVVRVMCHLDRATECQSISSNAILDVSVGVFPEETDI